MEFENLVREFWDHLVELPDIDRQLCENRARLEQEFITWSDNDVPINFATILQIMRGSGRLYYLNSYDRYICVIDDDQLARRISSIRSEAIAMLSENIEQDRGGIVILPRSLDPIEISVNQNNVISVTLQNSAPRIQSLTVIQALRCDENTFMSTNEDGEPIHFPLTIASRGSVRLSLQFSPAVVGVTNAIICFTFNDDSFSIGRSIRISCVSPEIIQTLGPTDPYQVKRKSKKLARGEPLKGNRPKVVKSVEYRPPDRYPIPNDWKLTCLSKGGGAKNLLHTLRDDITRNYQELFHKLLWSEELHMRREMDQYSMKQVTFTKIRNNLFSLTIPGLSEKRPSILRGDSITVHAMNTNNNQKNPKQYRGYAHQINLENVTFDFHRDFTGIGSYDVHFDLNTSVLRLSHQAIDHCSKLLTPNPLESSRSKSTYLFPELSIDNFNLPSTPFIGGRPFDPRLNAQQQLAVKNIVENRCQNVPYIIFGPPGTGKTSTITEAILQIGRHRPTAKILICAPSNTAADILLTRLSAAGRLTPKDMFRFLSFQRSQNEVDDVVAPYCCYSDQLGGYVMPSQDLFQTYRYVVCTCSMAGKLFNHQIPLGHFDVVVVDEAGHAWEPEITACFAAMLTDNERHSQLILAGDPKQLGPIVRSDASKVGGLHISLLERLTETIPIYARNLEQYASTAGYNPLAITKLLHCYRCHPDILALPNRMFYHNDLIACARADISDCMVGSPLLPNPDFPLLFHGVEGSNAREGNSPSWFNIYEIEVVMDYIQKLIQPPRSTTSSATAYTTVLPEDIGIITPYHKQVQKLKQILKSKRLSDIAVGSCEQFQGQEKKVIIISTVRSSDDYLCEDVYFNLGFVSNPKRFNVAITRAQALLVIIGNPFVLERDEYWGGLLTHCRENEAYVGCTFIPRSDKNGRDAQGRSVTALEAQFRNVTFRSSSSSSSDDGKEDDEYAMIEQNDEEEEDENQPESTRSRRRREINDEEEDEEEEEDSDDDFVVLP